MQENKSMEYIKKKKEDKKEIKNYNLVNEIEKGDALEINPYEIKRTKIKTNKISKQNNIKYQFQKLIMYLIKKQKII